MTKEEYYKIRNELKEKYNKDIADLDREYVLSNRLYNISDIVEDKIGRKGKIVSFIVRKWGDPYLQYKVENWTKKGTINKREPYIYMLEGDIIQK